MDAVDADRLIKPVPAVLEAAVGPAADQILVEGLGLRVHLVGVDMYAEAGAMLGSLLHQGVHVLGAAHPGADVPVVRVAGIMPLVGVALEQDGLTQPIGVKVYLLHIVQGAEEGILGLASEVHGDTPGNQIRHLLGSVRVVHDGPVGDGPVLPVDPAVLILVACDGHGHLGHFGLFDCERAVLGVPDLAMVVPGRAGQSEGC